MRLPTDATLLCGEGAAPELERIWREERLPVLAIGAPFEADLEAIRTATVVVCGQGGVEAARFASALGYRTFYVGEPPAPPGVRLASLDETLDAARAARARERWKAARRGGSD
jgi:hypothetical protein